MKRHWWGEGGVEQAKSVWIEKGGGSPAVAIPSQGSSKQKEIKLAVTIFLVLPPA